MPTPPVTPAAILHTAFSFWSSKVLRTAVEFDVFTKLAERPMTGDELGRDLRLHPRGIADFFDALVAMGFLRREGSGPDALHANTTETAHFLDAPSASCGGGILVS